MGLPRSFPPSARGLLLAALVAPALAAPLILLASGCPYDQSACAIPDDGKLASDGGADPCRCSDPPEPGDPGVCDCQTTEQGKVRFLACVQNLCDPDLGLNPQNPFCLAIKDGGRDRDASDDGPSTGCTGECLSSAPLGWSEPVLLWFGAESGAPTCPDVAPTVGFEGHASMSAPPAECGACSCQPPQGSCGPPAIVTASTAPCSGSGSPVPLDPVKWSDPCSPIQNAGGAASLTFGPLTLHESACSPVQPVPVIVPLAWATFARACEGNARGDCDSPGDICSPSAGGFRRCVYQNAERPCPAFGAYTEQHVFFESAGDQRGCSDCSCGSPVGGACAGSISTYADTACGVPLAPDAGDVSSLNTLCVDVPPGGTIGSASLGPEIVGPGACQPSGGEPTGSAVALLPATFCCIPAP
jgi:hypothetical protein